MGRRKETIKKRGGRFSPECILPCLVAIVMNVANLLGHNIQAPGAGNGHAGIIDVLNLTVHRWHKMAYSSFSGLPLPSVAIRTSVVKVTLSPSVKVTGLVNRTMSSEKGRGWRGKKNPRYMAGQEKGNRWVGRLIFVPGGSSIGEGKAM